MNTLRAELILGDRGVGFMPLDGTIALRHDTGWVRQPSASRRWRPPRL